MLEHRSPLKWLSVFAAKPFFGWWFAGVVAQAGGLVRKPGPPSAVHHLTPSRPAAGALRCQGCRRPQSLRPLLPWRAENSHRRRRGFPGSAYPRENRVSFSAGAGFFRDPRWPGAATRLSFHLRRDVHQPCALRSPMRPKWFAPGVPARCRDSSGNRDADRPRSARPLCRRRDSEVRRTPRIRSRSL